MKTFIASLLLLITASVQAEKPPVVSSTLRDEPSGSDSNESSSKPNILVILADDLGYSDVGFNGATDIRTPELDSLAENGTIFTSAYVTHPFCGPSRMGLMAGRYPHAFGGSYNLPPINLGIEEYNKLGIPVEETLISTVLQNAGYYTGLMGKWHLGMEKPYHPNNRGFDDFYGFPGGGHFYFPEKYNGIYERQMKEGKTKIHEYALPLEHNGKIVKETEYMTDALSREAVRFVKEAKRKNQPFFLYLAYNAPHTPLEAKEEDLKRYENIKDKKRQTYAAMVDCMDQGVGRVVDALKKTGQFDDTLIIFFSDNGGKTSSGATNRPLTKGKGSCYEDGYRVPMFFHWPRHVPAGQKFDHPVSALDFYPTFAGLAGAAIPDGKVVDGKDIWADFIAGRSPRKGDMIFAMRHQGGFNEVGARRDDWKVTRVDTGPWKLYNIKDDMGEKRDLSAQYPEQVKDMVASAEKWSRTHTEPKWFHELKARDIWKKTNMPNYDQTFSLGATARPTAAAPKIPASAGSPNKKLSKGDSTKEEFVAREKAKWVKNGWPWDQSKVEANFDKMDTNNDGIISGQEKKAYWSK